MKKETIILTMLIFALQGNAQNMGMCIYDAAGNRLTRFTYTDRNRSLRNLADKNGQVDMSNERLGNHTVHVTYNSTTCTLIIEILGLDDSDNCSAHVYSLTGQIVLNQAIDSFLTEINLFDKSSGVYLLRLTINGENRCWKIIKK